MDINEAPGLKQVTPGLRYIFVMKENGDNVLWAKEQGVDFVLQQVEECARISTYNE
jgi:hypothetical protein